MLGKRVRPEEIAEFRRILKECLEQRIARNRRYSKRAFSRDLGIPPGRLSEILLERRAVSRGTMERALERLRLQPQISSQSDLQRYQQTKR